MTSRIASGRTLMPSLLLGHPAKDGPPLPITPEMFNVTRDGMYRVVNGSGTAGRSRININGVQMAGKTGTAQVARLISRGSVSAWNKRDHALFVGFAPTDRPRYAISIVIEHGGFGASAAAPIAKDVLTFLFDPAAAWDSLLALEKTWGGTAQERLDARYRSYVSQVGVGAPKVSPQQEAVDDSAADGAEPTPSAPQTVVQNVDAPDPAPSPGPSTAAGAAPSPAPSPSTPLTDSPR